jgi:hypothetical protein
VILDGFTIQPDPSESFGLTTSPSSSDITFKNLKADKISGENTLVSMQGINPHLENCRFTRINAIQAFVVEFGDEGRMINDTLIQDSTYGGSSPVSYRRTLVVEGGYFESNFGDPGNGILQMHHFSLYQGQILSIDFARIQAGRNGIYISESFPGTLYYGSNNTEF